MDKKILIIDDDGGGIISGLINELSSYEFDNLDINDAGNVLESLTKNQYSAIILDMMMPTPESWSDELKRKAFFGANTGGVIFEVIRKEHPELPILIYSSKCDVGIKNDKKTYILTKPEFPHVIIEKLNELISGN